jgi:polyhydroxyalkanoate synthesis regulator phasin
MLDTLRKYVEAGMGAISSRRAEELARKLAEQGQARKEQVGAVAHDLMEWSRKNGERLAQTIRREVKRQIVALGVATKGEVESLKKRVAALEAKPGRAPARKTTARKTTARKTTARKTAARKRTT